MEINIRKLLTSRNLLDLIQLRELDGQVAKTISQRCQFTDGLIQRLGLEVELEGHQGCVNCLQWSPDGRHLASGSDDTNVIIWDPFNHKQVKVVPTPHIGNIFSVKYVGDESVIATASGDCRIVIQNVTCALSRSPPLVDCNCHSSRVKRLATTPDEPYLLWSAGEDGLVLQFDLREPHNCSKSLRYLVDLLPFQECKCISLNPTKPHYLAIGINDCFVRMYDRRKMNVTEIKGSPDHRKRSHHIDMNCVQYYAPSHLAKANPNILVGNKFAVTYISFNTAGSEMLVNIGGEQIYLFDVNQQRQINTMQLPHSTKRRRHPSHHYKNCCLAYTSKADDIHAIDLQHSPISNRSTRRSSNCACFYMRRAVKCFERKWMGDIYGAARDYLHVIEHWPDTIQAYTGLIRCLIALKWTEEGVQWLKYLLKIHPELEGSTNAEHLETDLRMLHTTSVTASTTTTTTTSNTSNEQQEGPVSTITFVSKDELELRQNSCDYERRFLGHCNTTTDIKEVNFLGDNNFVCAGSDEGIIFVWDKHSADIVNAFYGDSSIVNCIQPHPITCLLASSGIDSHVKIWSPRPEDGERNFYTVANVAAAVDANQKRMQMDPFDSMLIRMGFNVHATDGDFHVVGGVQSCRTS